MTELQEVYVVTGGNFGEDDPAVFAREEDAETYASLVGGAQERLLVCDKEVAAKMIAHERNGGSEEEEQPRIALCRRGDAWHLPGVLYADSAPGSGHISVLAEQTPEHGYEVTNRYADGTVGVTEEDHSAADLDGEPMAMDVDNLPPLTEQFVDHWATVPYGVAWPILSDGVYPPKGWTWVEKDDDADVFLSDEDAAQALIRSGIGTEYRYFDRETHEDRGKEMWPNLIGCSVAINVSVPTTESED